MFLSMNMTIMVVQYFSRPFLAFRIIQERSLFEEIKNDWENFIPTPKNHKMKHSIYKYDVTFLKKKF